MHLLATSSTSLDEIVEPVDLGQPPGDIAVLSFADSDLAGLAAAWAIERDALPSVRLAQLRDLKHPMSVDLWIERVGRHAKVIVVRLLGGLDWWRYGVERLAALARERGIALALLPGEDRSFGSGLFVDLVPSSCWFTNVRSCVDRRDWERLRRMGHESLQELEDALPGNSQRAVPLGCV